MTKIELVTREVLRIVTQEHTLITLEKATETRLASMMFNTISGRHEIECFFAIEFEQEQVDAWTTVQNIIDDVMNLWVSPITDPVVHKIGMGKTYGQFVAEPKPAINRIERADVENFKNGNYTEHNALNQYQRIATKSAIYPGKGTPFGLMYAALGLAEAGEVQNKVKKAFRDDGVLTPCRNYDGREVVYMDDKTELTDERRAQIIKELGGVLWYIAAVCDEINATMSEVALQNLEELCGRGERNTLRGDGDNR